jgi:putative transposase
VAQSLSSVLIHLIFSTKNRHPFIHAGVEAELHAYQAATLHELGCYAIAVNGMPDHLHLLFQLARTRALAEVVEEVKKRSSKWIKTKGPRFEAFHWQAGYGAFSIGESGVEALRQYIAGQKDHHRVKTFQDEFRAFLAKYKVPFDERYVWE